MAYCILFLLILATLVTQMSNGDKNKCHRAIQDFVKIVASCPKTKKEWDIAASKKNCEQLTSQALCGTSKEPYVYHCVINGFENETLEVCAPRKIIFGYCTEYNVAGGVIQGHKSAKCNSTFPKCGKSYNSTEAYKCTLRENTNQVFFSIILLHIHTCTIDNIQHLINSSEVNILKDNCILKSFRP